MSLLIHLTYASWLLFPCMGQVRFTCLVSNVQHISAGTETFAIIVCQFIIVMDLLWLLSDLPLQDAMPMLMRSKP